MSKDLLKYRNEKKAKKPTFLRQDGHKKAKLKKTWRQPKGMHSKMRLKLRSYRKQPSTGYSSPRSVRGLDKLGNEFIIINNVNELNGVKTPVTISSHVGLRKKIEILKKCVEMKLEVKNVKNVNAFIKDVEDRRQKKKEAAKKKTEAKKKSKDEALKKAEKKKEAEKTDEEKEAESKEEKRKIMEGKA